MSAARPASWARRFPTRRGLTSADFQRSIAEKLYYAIGRFPSVATRNDKYLAVALAVRDRLLERWLATASTYARESSRTVCYLSAEFLLGPHLGNALLNLGVQDAVREACSALGLDLDEVIAQEEEPGLGNGGLGRLAACYLDSLATLEIPAIGYGIRYEYGIFDQTIRDGWQVETTDNWLRLGNPWEIAAAGDRVPGLLRRPHRHCQRRERTAARGLAARARGQGRRPRHADPRLPREHRQHAAAVERAGVRGLRLRRPSTPATTTGPSRPRPRPRRSPRCSTRTTTTVAGKQLRLEQQYFFVSCALQDMIRIHLQSAPDLERFDRKYAVQLNDTHPSLAVAELMRLLVDVHALPWERAWEITTRTFGYTNHTLLPEALEKWPLPLFGSLLPRHLEIVYEINAPLPGRGPAALPRRRGARAAAVADRRDAARATCAWPTWPASAPTRSTASRGCTRELLRDELLRDFSELWPEKFRNVTNGVTPRRFLALVNPGALGADHARHRRRLGLQPRRAARSWSRSPRTRASAPSGGR